MFRCWICLYRRNRTILKAIIPPFENGIYYYTSGQKYEATHAWAFQEEMMKQASTDCEKAFSYGKFLCKKPE
jgi:hypothetical protein